MRLRALFPKQPLTPMHLLALVGSNGIGRLGYQLPGRQAAAQAMVMDRKALLSTAYTPESFDELVRAYLSTGAGIAGMQPKIMVPDRPTIPIPTLIVKTASEAYPGLAANEFLCLTAASKAGILAPMFDVVTTSIYRYQQYAGGPDLEDRTLALKLFAGRGQTKAYPTTQELLKFGREVCGVNRPEQVLQRIADAMTNTLQQAETDERIPGELLTDMRVVWEDGMMHGRKV